MKIIDLLLDLNNFNEGGLVNMPEKIKYNNKIFYFNSDDVKGYYTEKPGCGGESLLKEIMNLNHIVEIIEEKKIPEKLGLTYLKDDDRNNIIDKINEIIDYLDYLKSKGE